MNIEMAYLLGMVCGNGEIQRNMNDTIVSITIPHKKLVTEEFHDIKLYVKASIADIRNIIEPLIGNSLKFIQDQHYTIISFSKSNNEYLIREIVRYIGRANTHNEIRLDKEVLNFSMDEKKYFLKGFADVTGYIRRSNRYFNTYEHRVYVEIPNNWQLVIDICNLLKSIDIPIQNIDWAHPNMRDGYCKKYNDGNCYFWKKEHQIKIWANEFLPIGFGILHKQQALDAYSKELIAGYTNIGKNPSDITHKYYWDNKKKYSKNKIQHPCENDEFIPKKIRGKHFNSWIEIASELGYVK